MIPIYRAKKIDSDEYVIGFYVEVGSVPNIYNNDLGTFGAFIIDQSTLAIHFSNMIDIKGDKIFASLQEDEKGGDILFDMEYEFTLSFDGLKFKLEGLFSQPNFNKFDKWEAFDIIGIKE